MKNVSKTMAFWLLRIWLGARSLFTGLTKFQGTKEVPVESVAADSNVIAAKPFMPAGMEDAMAPTKIVQTLGFDHYHALPEKGPMSIESFKASPFMPELMVEPYAFVLGGALIILGLALLAGICTRITLFLTGLLYISLTFGFIILEPTMGQASAAGIAYLGVHMIMIVGALLLANHNKFELLPCSKICPKLACQKSCGCQKKED